MLKDFRDFILRGNVIELAVAVVMATQFNRLIESIVANIINPAIAQVGGEPDLSEIKLGDFTIGNLLNDIIAFLLVAIAVYFFIILPYNKLNELRSRGEVPDETPPPEDIQLLREIRDALVRR
jgi:large conductance mechanosensitive channel